MSRDPSTSATSTREGGRSTDIPTAEVGLVFLTYAFLVFIRASGLASLFHYPSPRNPLAAPPLRTIGEFVFYDFISLAVIGLVGSGTLIGLSLADLEKEQFRRTKLVAASCVGIPGLIYIIGTAFIALA